MTLREVIAQMALFQFYNSSIKTTIGALGLRLIKKFQFYNSSIKTIQIKQNIAGYYIFQFYNSSIKTAEHGFKTSCIKISILQ